MTNQLPQLPISIVNRILEEASALNNDTWILQFKESGQRRRIKMANNNYPKHIVSQLRVNHLKFANLIHMFMGIIIKPCILKIGDNGMYIKSYDCVQNIRNYENGIVLQYHNIKTVGFVNGVKLNIIANMVFSYRSIDNNYLFIHNSGILFILENKSYKQVESATFENGILQINLFEFNANWQWNAELQINEYVVNVEVDGETDSDSESESDSELDYGYDDYDDFYSDEENNE
jgi:hypothetical protein